MLRTDRFFGRLPGEWTDTSAQGCHLNGPNWKRNPRYQLRLESDRPSVKCKITLTRPEDLWKGPCGKDSVGNMMGFYLMSGRRDELPERGKGVRIQHDGRPWEAPFVPMHSVGTPPGFLLEVLPPDEVYWVVPATFEPQKLGPFFLTVSADTDFSFKRAGRSGR